MRINRLRLRHFRGVDECDITFDVDGVTIIEGDNEVGKTCIPEAIDLILTYRHDTTHRAARVVRPVHIDEGPEVELEMTTGPYHFTYAKRWHRRPMTTLEVTEPTREQHTGREAHDRVQTILDETLDTALWAALRLDQGTKLAQAAFADAPSLARALDTVAGGETEVAGEREDDLWARICDERDKYWTGTGRPSKDRAQLADNLEACRKKIAEIQGRIDELADDAAEVARLGDQLAELDAQLGGQRGSLDGLEAEWKKVDERRQAVAQLDAKLQSANALHSQLAAEHDTRQKLIERMEKQGRALADLEAERAEAEPQRTAAEAAVTKAEKVLTASHEVMETAETERDRAASDRDLLRNQIDLELLAERQERVEIAQADLDEAEQVLEANRVDDPALEAIDNAELALTMAEGVAEQAATVVSATALADCEITVDGEPVALDEGATDRRTVKDDLDITVPGVVSINVHSGTETRSLGDEVRSARDELAESCAAVGVADADAARAAHKARRDAETRRDQAVATVKRDVRDLTPDVLTGKVNRLREQVAEAEATRPDEPPPPPDLDAAETALIDAGQLLTEARTNEDERRRHWDDATARCNQLQVTDAGKEAAINQAGKALEGSEAELGEARADRSDTDLETELTKTAVALTIAQRRHTDAAAELEAADPDSLEARLDNARGVVKRTEEAIGKQDDRRRTLTVKLEIAGEEGLAQALDEAKTSQAHLHREHDRLEARAAAAMLLHDTVAVRRDAARQRYVAPFRERIEKLGRIVFGHDLEVELDDELRIARRTLEGVTLDFDQLSVGAREQLGIISRLACAQIVSAEGGAPVIFDDALGWSDPRRLERMGAIISGAVDDCQVIVLTCTPGRYASVGAARVVTLPQ